MKNSYLLSLGCGKKYIHNNRERFTHGFRCNDCGRFIPNNTLEYFMTEGFFNIGLGINNMHVDFIRKERKSDITEELKRMMEKALSGDKWKYKLTKKQAEKLMNNTYQILDKYRIKDNAAIIVLKKIKNGIFK